MPAVNLFLAYSVLGGQYATSPTGATWTTRTGGEIFDVSLGGRLLAAGTQPPNTDGYKPLLNSTDGLTWAATSALTPAGTYRSAAALSSGRWVMVGRTAPTVIYSDDNGVTWSDSGVSGVMGTQLASNGTTLVATSTVNFDYTAEKYVNTSTDGITWTATLLDASSEGYNVFWFAGYFWVLAARKTGISKKSVDGITWTDLVGAWPSPHEVHGYSRSNPASQDQRGRRATVRGRFAYLPTNYGILRSDSGGAWEPFAGNGFWYQGASPLTYFGAGTSVAISDDGLKMVTVGDNYRWSYSADGGLTWAQPGSSSGLFNSYGNSLDRVIWVGDTGPQAKIFFPLMNSSAGSYAKGSGVLTLPALYAVAPPEPPRFWSRRVGTSERS